MPASTFRRRTVIALIAFLALSIGVHFTLGPALTQLTPHWSASDIPEQALSIVTLSHRDRVDFMNRPPTPTPTPLPLPQTRRDLSVLRNLEIGDALRMRSVRPPARRKSTLIIERPPHARTDVAKDAAVVSTQPEPTPQAHAAAGASRADSGAKQDDLAGSVVWGDDNPPRVIKLAALSVADPSGAAVRVAVEVDPDGHVLSVRIAQSSGDAALDQAALVAASASLYAPATLNGMPVHGSCIVEFGPGAQTT